MAKKVKTKKDGLRAKFEKAYVEMKDKSSKERQSRAGGPGKSKGDSACECGK